MNGNTVFILTETELTRPRKDKEKSEIGQEEFYSLLTTTAQ